MQTYDGVVLSKEIQKLILDARMSERALIIYVIQSDLADNNYPGAYKLALKDEVKNHKIAIKEYRSELKKLK
jgi:hypothetical protein